MGDEQKLKKVAASSYDYDNDPRWADYWSNVLIPPHMASRSNVITHFKRKFYQRYIVPVIYKDMESAGCSPDRKAKELLQNAMMVLQRRH